MRRGTVITEWLLAADTAAATGMTDKEDATERVTPRRYRIAADTAAATTMNDNAHRRCHFIRSNVFWSSCKSEALPVFSRELSIHFFSRASLVGRAFW